MALIKMQANLFHSPAFRSLNTSLSSFKNSLAHVDRASWFGQVTAVQGLLIEVTGITQKVHLGSTIQIHKRGTEYLPGQVVGFREHITLVMAYGMLEGVTPGARVDVMQQGLYIYPTMEWKGRVMNAVGEPLDQLGPLPQGDEAYHLKASPPPAQTRLRTKERMDLGIRALNTFTTCCRGQRIGVFSGSGVGKSVLLGQITRFTECDIVVVGLIGERGREVNEFLEEQLGEEGLKRAVVVVATSDMSALVRRQAAYMTLTLAEYFRDQRLNVLCIMDSVTRFAAAQREIGLSVGEPPTTRGFPPTVFAELPRLLERAGTTHHEGSITGIFSVLVEGDDHNEPITDATRSILDGHIVLDRAIAERGRFPAVNILKSLSRTMPDCNQKPETTCIIRARQLMAIYEDMQEMIQLGAYRPGSSAEVDEAIQIFPKLNAFLNQDKEEKSTLEEGFHQLEEILNT